MRAGQATRLGAGILIVTLAVLVRAGLVGHVTPDIVLHFVPWIELAAQLGPWRALGAGISDYTPAFDYTVIASTVFRGRLPDVVAIKIIPMAFDLVSAGCVYWLARRRWGAGGLPLAGFAAVLFTPTVFLNSAAWGQVDSTFTACLLMGVCLVVARRAGWASVLFGLALSLKLQALFLAPFFGILLLRGIIPWRYALAPVVVYLVIALPAALAGRPVVDLLFCNFVRYADDSTNISIFAPNLYHLCVLRYELCFNATLAVAAEILAVLGTLALVALFAWQRGALDDERLLVGATLSVALLPFLLPHMHERYFYAADVFSIGLAFHQPRLWWLPVAFQLSSFPGYGSYLFDTHNKLVLLGSVINLAVILWLSFYARRLMFPDKTEARIPCISAPST